MSQQQKGTRNIQSLLAQRAESAEQTRQRMERALDRFEHGQLENLPHGTSLTVRNLAVEAGVSKDTPLARYREPHPQAGQYRYPALAKRFKRLKQSIKPRAVTGTRRTGDRKLQEVIREKDRQLLLSARANNVLDAKVVELEGAKRELEEEVVRLREELSQLRQEGMKIIPPKQS